MQRIVSCSWEEQVPSIAFDQAAEYYDRTRGYAEGVAERIRDAIVDFTHATSASRFLELGVGTGRIALPFIRAGYDYTGVDISRKMMDQLTRKLASDPDTSGYRYHLVHGDITHLPFDDDTFDVAITVHVLHLVDGWQQALREAHRVVRKPGGWLLIGYDAPAENAAPSAQHIVNAQWGVILKELGTNSDALLPGIPNSRRARLDAHIESYLREIGAHTEVVTLVEHAVLPLSLRAMVERHRARMYSRDWLLPEGVHAEAMRRLEAWLDTECDDPDRAINTTTRFMAVTARW